MLFCQVWIARRATTSNLTKPQTFPLEKPRGSYSGLRCSLVFWMSLYKDYHALGWTYLQRLFILYLLRREKYSKCKINRKFRQSSSLWIFFTLYNLHRNECHLYVVFIIYCFLFKKAHFYLQYLYFKYVKLYQQNLRLTFFTQFDNSLMGVYNLIICDSTSSVYWEIFVRPPILHKSHLCLVYVN